VPQIIEQISLSDCGASDETPLLMELPNGDARTVAAMRNIEKIILFFERLPNAKLLREGWKGGMK
jgi:hypothetical protein